MIFVSGMIGWDAQGVFRATDFAGQVRQALANVVAVLAEAGAAPEHIVRMTWYVLDKHEYIAAYPAIGVAYREIIGRHFPAMTAVIVAGLLDAVWCLSPDRNSTPGRSIAELGPNILSARLLIEED